MIAGKLGDKIEAAVADPAWVTKAVENGRAQLHAIADPSLRGAAQDGLDHLASNADELANVSHRTFLAITARLQLGQPEPARLEWLAKRASFAERMAALDAATDAALHRVADDAEAWATVKKLALEFLQIAGQVGLPLLLAAL